MTSTPQTYALLIGVDHYPASTIYDNLNGCVRDINLVDAYLKTGLKLPGENISKLLSPNPTHNSLANVRAKAEADALEATYENIVKAFKGITESAQPGDRIYIHYAGHGGRVVTQYPELKGEEQNDEGLVPTDINATGRYIRDIELTTLLKRMTDKGLIVTVALDSCHSGGATRSECAIRGASEVDTRADSAESLVGKREELIENWRSLTQNSHKNALLPDSQDYVLLAACRPTEFAYEWAVSGQDRHGALTYWMIDTLNALGNNISYKTLHSRVSAKIQSQFPTQLPMILGPSERICFQSEHQQTKYTANVLFADKSKDLVTLSVGAAQGMSVGTRFGIYPLDTFNFDEQTQQQAVVEIVEIEAAQSTAKVISTKGDRTKPVTIEQGSPAVILSTPVELMRRVKLYEQKTAGAQEQELPEALVNQQAERLSAVRQALADNGWIVEAQADEESHYQVAIDREGNYEICAGMPIKNLTPALKSDDPAAPEQVVNRLVHLAKYQAVQELDNPASELADCLDCQILNANKQLLSSYPISIRQGEKIFLRIHNKSSIALNVAVLDMDPAWKISQIYLRNVESPFYQMNAGETIDTPLRMRIPNAENYRQARETLKVFATLGSADFRWLCLPSLDQAIERRGSMQQRSSNPFARLIETIGGDPAIAPLRTRAAIYEADADAEWMTQQIPLTFDF